MSADADAWKLDGACRHVDPDLMFPERGEYAHHAKAVCAPCPVIAECLAYALDNGEHHGIWGGTSERERRKLRRNRDVEFRILPTNLSQHRGNVA